MKGTIIFDLEGTLVNVGGEPLSRVFIEEKELKQLATEYELSIVTGATRVQLEYVLSSTFLGAYFDANNTISKDECSEDKATGKPFQTLLDRGFSTPVVIIGDSEGDRLGSEILMVPFVDIKTAKLQNEVGAMDTYIEEALQKLR